MYHVSAQSVDERMINVHYYYYYKKETDYPGYFRVVFCHNRQRSLNFFYVFRSCFKR